MHYVHICYLYSIMNQNKLSHSPLMPIVVLVPKLEMPLIGLRKRGHDGGLLIGSLGAACCFACFLVPGHDWCTKHPCLAHD